MKRIWKYLFLLISLSFGEGWREAYSQNLVKNSGFEEFIICPNSEAEISRCTYWHNAGDSLGTSTSDYFHECSSANGIAPPNLVWGYQWPHNGSGFAHIGCFIGGANANIREYIQGELTQSLVIGQKYYVSFFANLMGGNGHTIASNKLGALFTTYLFTNPNYAHILNYAHIYTDSIITDTVGWFHVKGIFIADSAYSFITIANFFDNAHTDTISLQGANSIVSDYNIDDVCVSTDSTTCFLNVGIKDVTRQSFAIFPNPCNNKLIIQLNELNPESIELFDVTGKKIIQRKTIRSEKELIIDVADYSPGVYFIRLNFKDYAVNRRVVVY